MTCILWEGKKNKAGYGKIGNNYAHREIYKQQKGEIPVR